MPNLKLSYFDFNGGRGEAARLALSLGKIPFEDDRIPLAAWPTVRGRMPLHSMPVLEVDGEVITQSNAINRYVGRLAGFYPEDPLEALRCDEVMDAIEDLTTQIMPTFSMADEDAKREARQALADGPISLYLARLNEMLVTRGGKYFADNRLTVADLRIFVWIRHLRSGQLDYVPIDLADRVAPRLVDHYGRINDLPDIVNYYERISAAS